MKQRKSNRLKGFDYSQDNLYFVTSCVHNRVCCFGHVGTGRDLSQIEGRDPFQNTGRDPSIEPQMILNDYGKIAEQQWYWLAEQYRYIILHEFIVMPNHIHGIIEINRNTVGTGRDLSVYNRLHSGTGHDLSLPKIKSLSELMGAYKTTVSKKIYLSRYTGFAWQRSFHDHVIRDEKSYEKIASYIIDNPQCWPQDQFYYNER